jgi:hypothetical protein
MRCRVFSPLAVATSTLATVLAVQSGHAHHGFTNHFDPDEERTITGVVTQFDFINPHVTIHLDVVNSDAETESWVVEMGGSSGYLRSGRLSRDSIKPGDQLLVVGHPARANAFEMRANHIELPGGGELNMNNPYVEIPFLQENDEAGDE